MEVLRKRYDLISDLNLGKLEQERMLAGRELNKRGAALEKAVPESMCLVQGATNLIQVDCLVVSNRYTIIFTFYYLLRVSYRLDL